MQQWPDLTSVLTGVQWAIVGAVAARQFMPERATRDLEIAVATSDLGKASRLFLDAGFQKQGDLSIGGSSWVAQDGTPVEVIEARDAWWPQAFAEAEHNRDARGAPMLTAPYLVLMKVLAGRLQDFADVGRILGGLNETALDGVRFVFRSFAPEELNDLESAITLGKLEHQQQVCRPSN